MKSKQFVSSTFLFFISYLSFSCTIFSGIDENGQVWTANNEDNPFNFYNYINIFPKTEDSKYGYFTLSYDSPVNGENYNTQGGMNEAGLFYDFNTIPKVRIKDLHKKKKFPQGSDKILSHILANFETTEQVVAFFDEYWFENGFNTAQMHVADKSGTFAIIGPSGSQILENQRYQASTNFDICGNGDASNSWRYPIVIDELEKNKISLETFKDVCEKTSQKGRDWTYTIYSNIQNLTTGEIWFYFLSDYENAYKTSIQKLLSKGRKSILLRDLFPNHALNQIVNELEQNGGQSAFEQLQSLHISKERKDEITSIFLLQHLDKDYNMEALPFLDAYLEEDRVGYWLRAAQAIGYFQSGQKEKAKSIIHQYKEEVPETSMDTEKILNLFEGILPTKGNVYLELNGYEEAKHVFVKGGPFNYENFNFLIQKNGKWVGRFEVPPGIYKYQFIVDGQKVVDPKTPVVNGQHELIIGFSKDMYRRTIRVKVPNKDDVVYIAGNQSSLTNWNSVFRLVKTSDYEREITLDLHYPAEFKFTRGDWSSEAILKHGQQNEDGFWAPVFLDIHSEDQVYEVVQWKDQE